MPRYVYHCSTCAKEYEVEKPVARAAQAEPCPECGQTGTRFFTAPAVSGTKLSGAPAGGPGENCANCCASGTCGHK